MAIYANRWQLKKEWQSIDSEGTMTDPNISVFTITADILARLLANVVVLNVAVYDKHDYCPAWAARGDCKKSNWTWMRDNCPLSCHVPREYLVHLHI